MQTCISTWSKLAFRICLRSKHKQIQICIFCVHRERYTRDARGKLSHWAPEFLNVIYNENWPRQQRIFQAKQTGGSEIWWNVNHGHLALISRYDSAVLHMTFELEQITSLLHLWPVKARFCLLSFCIHTIINLAWFSLTTGEQAHTTYASSVTCIICSIKRCCSCQCRLQKPGLKHGVGFLGRKLLGGLSMDHLTAVDLVAWALHEVRLKLTLF